MKKLYKNGKIYTMENPNEIYYSVLVSEGKIEQLFSERETNLLNEEHFKVIDLNGNTMFPGFVDTHIHVMGIGIWLSSVILNGLTDIEEIKFRISEKAKNLNQGEWLVAEGFDENLLNGVKLYKEDLDNLVPNNPVYVKRVCRHAGIVNSEALNLLNIKDDIKDPEGGNFEKENGKLNGWVYDTAMEPFDAIVTNEDEASLTQHLHASIEYLQQFGLTGAHTEDLGYYNDYKDVLNAYKNVVGINKNQKAFRVRLLRHHSVYEEMIKDKAKFVNEWIEPDAMKFYADGAFGGSTALLKEPYSDDETNQNYGLAIYTQKELEEKVKLARDYNGAIAVHMIGDKACEMVLDAIEKYPAPKGLRDRLIHISTLNENLLNRVSRLPVICDVQPQFITSDFPWVREKVGNNRAKYLYPFKTMMEKNIIIGGGSDGPIETPNPLLGIHAAVNRSEVGSNEIYNKEQCLSVYDAIRLYTTEASKIAQTTESTGYIKEGYQADFTVLKENPFEVGKNQIANIEVSYTIVNGEIVYECD